MGTETTEGKRTEGTPPPYIAYRTFKNLLAWLGDGERTFPSHIDPSVLRGKWSGGAISQIISALEFLRLINSEKRPTPEIHGLINKPEDEFRKNLEAILRERYSPLFTQIDLASTTRAKFEEAFKGFPGSGSVKRKGMKFFREASKDAGLTISTFISAPEKRGPKSQAPALANHQAGRRRKSATPPALEQPATHSGQLTEFQKALLETIPKWDPDWPPETKKSYFDFLRELHQTDKGGGGPK